MNESRITRGQARTCLSEDLQKDEEHKQADSRESESHDSSRAERCNHIAGHEAVAEQECKRRPDQDGKSGEQETGNRISNALMLSMPPL